MTNTLTILLEKNNIDPLGLTNLVNKPFFKKLSMKLKCELINDMRVPMGLILCTPDYILKKIGFKKGKKQLSNVISNIRSHLNQKLFYEYLVGSSFRISHFKNKEISDYGFFDHRTSQSIQEKMYSQGVADMNSIEDDDYYNGGFNPKVSKELKLIWEPFEVVLRGDQWGVIPIGY